MRSRRPTRTTATSKACRARAPKEGGGDESITVRSPGVAVAVF